MASFLATYGVYSETRRSPSPSVDLFNAYMNDLLSKFII